MTDLPYCPSSGRPFLDAWPSQALAGIAAWANGLQSYDNPHSAHREPIEYAAWRDGYAAARSANTSMQHERGRLREEAQWKLVALLVAGRVPDDVIDGVLKGDAP